MDKKLPGILLEKYKIIGTVVFSVLFSVVYLNVSAPFSPTSWFVINSSIGSALTLGFCFSVIIILSLSRYLMYRFRLKYGVSLPKYVLWCAVELVIVALLYTFITCSIFPAIDTEVFKLTKIPPAESFGIVFGRALLYGLVCLGVPNLISGMYHVIADKNRTIQILAQQNVMTDDSTTDKGDTIFTMYDMKGALKLSVKSSNLYYVESDDNYIKAWYSDINGEMKMYMIRCRLKTIEDNFRGTSLIRCHRQYIVNSENVRMLKKEPDGYFLHLDNDNIPPIPVSKTYLQSIISLF